MINRKIALNLVTLDVQNVKQAIFAFYMSNNNKYSLLYIEI